MSIMKRDFDISDVLSVTTRSLVSTRHIDGIYDIMRYVTGDPELGTSQFAKMADGAKQTILKQHPELADVTFPDITKLPDDKRRGFIADWLSQQEKLFGKTLSITPTDVPVNKIATIEVDKPDLPKGPPGGGPKPGGYRFG